MIYCLVVVSASFACVSDKYLLSGNFSHLEMSDHDHHILLKGATSMSVIDQPTYPKYSYVADFMATGLIIEYSVDGSCYAQALEDSIQITCHHKDCRDSVNYPNMLIDAGHGGKDPGAIAIDGTYEKKVTLDFAKRLQQAFTHYPEVDITLLREEDTFVSKYDRLKAIIEHRPNLLISIHADAYHHNEAKGISVFHLDNSLGSEQSQEIVKTVKTQDSSLQGVSKRYAKSLLDHLNKDYHLHSIHPLPMPLVVLRSPLSPSILIELGFLSNPKESALLQNHDYLNQLAADIALSVINQYRVDNKLLEIKRY